MCQQLSLIYLLFFYICIIIGYLGSTLSSILCSLINPVLGHGKKCLAALSLQPLSDVALDNSPRALLFKPCQREARRQMSIYPVLLSVKSRLIVAPLYPGEFTMSFLFLLNSRSIQFPTITLYYLFAFAYHQELRRCCQPFSFGNSDKVRPVETKATFIQHTYDHRGLFSPVKLFKDTSGIFL